MEGILVVNSFLTGKKFVELYKMLVCSADRFGISLTVKKNGEILHSMDFVRQIPCDFVLFWDKDVLLAQLFEKCGKRVFNPSDAIACCDNKALTYLKLSESGVKIPKTIIAPMTYEGVGFCDTDFADSAALVLGFPLVVKELCGSFGQQVYLVNDLAQLHSLINRLGHRGFLFQEFIKTSIGKDVRINTVGKNVVSSMLRFNENGDFRSNISNGGSMKKYIASREQVAAALSAAQTLGLDFAGVDVMFGENDEPLICEVNSNPNFKSSYECTGIDMGLEILKHIKKVVNGK